jgi:YVTN family beta-propeller protein
VTHDGETVVVANRTSNTVSLIDTATNTVVKTLNVSNSPECVAVSPVWNLAYVGHLSGSGYVTVINTAQQSVLGVIETGIDSIINDLAVSPNGRRLYVVYLAAPGKVLVVHIAVSQITGVVDYGLGTVIGTSDSPAAAAISPDGSRLYLAISGSSFGVDVIDTATESLITNAPLPTPCLYLGVDPDGSRVFVGRPAYVSVFATATNTVTSNILVGGYPAGIAATSDSAKIYVIDNANDFVSVIDGITLSVSPSTIAVGTGPHSRGHFLMPGPVQVGLFSDGFENGETSAWSFVSH